MKKISVLLVALTVSAIAFADVGIDLKNNATSVYVAGSGGATAVDQAVVQLIWTPNAPLQQAGVGGAVGATESLLDSFTTTSGYEGTWSDIFDGTDVYTDSDVGEVDINAGYFFVRVFDSAAMGLGDNYLQQYAQGPSLTEYDFQAASTIYDTNGSLGGAIDAQGYQIIPEPAVASLIGVAAVGFLAGRRLFTTG